MSQVVTTQARAITSPLMGGSPDAGPSSFVIRQATPSSSANVSNGIHQQARHPSKSASPAKSVGAAYKVPASPARNAASPFAAAASPGASSRSRFASRPLSRVQWRVPATPPPTSWLKWDHLQPSSTARREYVDLTADDDGPYVDLTQDEPVRGVVLREPSSSPAKPARFSQPLVQRQPKPTQQQALRPVGPPILPPPDEPHPRSDLPRAAADQPQWQSALRLQKRPKHQEGGKRARLECAWAVRKAEFTAKEYREVKRCKRTFATAEALFRHVNKHVEQARRKANRALTSATGGGSTGSGYSRSSSTTSHRPQAKIGCRYADCASSLKTWTPEEFERHLLDIHFNAYAYACPFDSCRLSEVYHEKVNNAAVLASHIEFHHEEGDPLRPLMAPVKPTTKLAPPPPLPKGIVPWHTVTMPERIKVVKTDWRPSAHAPKAQAEGVLAEPAAPAEPGVQPWPKLIQMWTHLEAPAIPLHLDGVKTRKLEAVYIEAPRGPPIDDREPCDFSKAELPSLRRGLPPAKRLKLSKLLPRKEVDYVDVPPVEDIWPESASTSKPRVRRIPPFPRNLKLATPPPERVVPEMPEWSESEEEEEEGDVTLRHWPVMDLASGEAGAEKPWLVGEDASVSSPAQEQGLQFETMATSIMAPPGRSTTLSKETVEQRRREAVRSQRPGPTATMQAGKTLVARAQEGSDEEMEAEAETASPAFESSTSANGASQQQLLAAASPSIAAASPSSKTPLTTLKQSSLTSFFRPPPAPTSTGPTSASQPQAAPDAASPAPASAPAPAPAAPELSLASAANANTSTPSVPHIAQPSPSSASV